MIKREQEMDKEFCVFYHSYNGASLLYEVQAELARCAFGLPDDFAPLPRVMQKDFTGASIPGLKASFKDMIGQDHNPQYRKLAISATPTLFCFGSEAPPLHCFRGGYGCGDLSFRGLLVKLLQDACGCGDVEAGRMASKLAHLATKFGLQGGCYDDSTGHNAPVP